MFLLPPEGTAPIRRMPLVRAVLRSEGPDTTRNAQVHAMPAWTYNRVAGLGGDRGTASPATASQERQSMRENRVWERGGEELLSSFL